ncbi:hypothetical protein ACFYZ9_33635 [Streptomyces sp. NPDC001691]|uniref:hypothetical protein n=1 Tax=Streptomyces sp. NPDC001691 TaxID=3364600 RepID=UPI00369E8056
MSLAVLSVPFVRHLFPPPSAPLRFADGDRYEWRWPSGDAWKRAEGHWRPDPDDGWGWLNDAEVQEALKGAIRKWRPAYSFVPRLPGARLPGRPVDGIEDLDRMWGYPSPSVAPYVLDHQSGRLVPVRDLVAQHDPDAAYDFAPTITRAEMLDVMGSIQKDQERPEFSYDESAGRLYARYRRPSDFGVRGSAGFPSTVTCLHVFVLSAPSEVR